jgi:hypothetical protein
MCFSPEGDLASGVVVLAIGLDALRHTQRLPVYVAGATLPVLFGLHQIVESFVWWGLRGDVPAGLGRVAMWVYLLFALVALPVIVPVLLVYTEPMRARRWRYLPFVLLGVVTATVILETMLAGNPGAHLGHYHIAYSIGLRHGIVVIGLYIVATCGPFLVSRSRPFRWFGLANLVAVVVLAQLAADGFTSLWCLYAALVSAMIALHLRLDARRQIGDGAVVNLNSEAETC